MRSTMRMTLELLVEGKTPYAVFSSEEAEEILIYDPKTLRFTIKKKCTNE